MRVSGRSAVLGAGLLAVSAGLSAHAGDGGLGGARIKRVLLISIDGMHALDFINCSQGISGVNSGAPYCPNLAELAGTGVNYLDTSTSKPSDSFPGLMALVSGGSPRTVGGVRRRRPRRGRRRLAHGCTDARRFRAVQGRAVGVTKIGAFDQVLAQSAMAGHDAFDNTQNPLRATGSSSYRESTLAYLQEGIASIASTPLHARPRRQAKED